MKQVFIHGLGQNSTAWNKTIANLSDNRNITNLDLVSIIEKKECTYENLYKALSLQCNNDGKPIRICGLSLGSIMALNFAIENPEKVSSLILIAPQYKMPKMLLGVQNIVFRAMPKSSFASIGFDKKSVIKLTKSMMNLDFSDRLKEITCPTLLLCGQKDKVNLRACKKLLKLMPNATMKVIEKSGHEMNLDAPDSLASAINSFRH